MTRAILTALFVTLLLSDVARGDDAIPRYVAQQGDDLGDCSLPVRPCRTIQYAVSVAGKGDQVRVAGGTYRLTDVLQTLQVVASAVDVQGGFNRFDHFLRQAPGANTTTLTGVPVPFRDQLRARGFHVVVDKKGLDAAGHAAVAGYGVTQRSSAGADCVDEAAGNYPCDNIDLLAHVARRDLSSRPGVVMDVWGFVDLNTEREYALLGVHNGLVVVDVTDPTSPFEVGTVPGAPSGWRDVKVAQRYDDDADRWRTYGYVSAEQGGWLVVVDLTELPNRVRLGRRLDAAAHNVYVGNVDYTTGIPLEESRTPPLLQVLGSAKNRGAFRSFDIGDPLNPVQVAASSGGYSHDATSMLIEDDRASACATNTETCEVLLDFNESHIEIWDFSDQEAPELLSSTTYDNAGYVHSGWWTEDGGYLFVHDEFDESRAALDTTVRVFDLEDLTSPQLVKVWTGPTPAIDHNGYVRGNRYFMSNYTRGLTILDITDPTNPMAVGYFDTYPSSDNTAFSGAWGVYPFLPSGNLLVSDFQGGLFVLADRTRSAEHVRIGFTRSAFAGEEGDDVSVSVVRTGGGGDVAVDYAVLVGSAGGADLVTSKRTLHWPAEGDADGSRRISVPLLRDDIAEPIERAFVRLSNPSGGAVLGDINMASVFIGDPGRTASIGFAETEIAVDETANRLIATVRRMDSPLGDVSVDYEVRAISASPGSDYEAIQPGRLSWADGDATARTIIVPILDDGDDEEHAEQFEIGLSGETGATLANDRLVVEIAADGMAVTGFMLYANERDLQPLLHGRTIATDAVPDNPGVRVEIRDSDGVGSVGLTVDGTDETHIANEAPYVFGVLGDSPQGRYALRATPYAEDDLGGSPGLPMRVTFFVGEQGGVLSSDASLRNLEMTGIDLDFARDIETYDITVGPQVEQTTVSTTIPPGATVRISPVDAESEMANHQVDLATGLNTIDVTVTAEDGEATRNYTLRVVRAPFVQGP